MPFNVKSCTPGEYYQYSKPANIIRKVFYIFGHSEIIPKSKIQKSHYHGIQRIQDRCQS